MAGSTRAPRRWTTRNRIALAGVVGSLTIAALREPVAEWCRVAMAPEPGSGASIAYVFTLDDKPLQGAMIFYGDGAQAYTDRQGRVALPRQQGPQLNLMIYDRSGVWLGEYTLRARQSGEWEPVRIRQTESETAKPNP